MEVGDLMFYFGNPVKIIRDAEPRNGEARVVVERQSGDRSSFAVFVYLLETKPNG